MAKFTRTAYASGSLRETARQIAAYAGLEGSLSGYNDVHQHKGAGRKRVRITILVEPEAPAPKPERKPRRPRPVQLSLTIPEPDAQRPTSASPELANALGRLLEGTPFAVPASAVLGGA